MSNSKKEDFIYSHSKYYGDFSPQKLAFNHNLQDFSNQISRIVGLETGGKISANDAYAKIKKLFGELSSSMDGLEIGNE